MQIWWISNDDGIGRFKFAFSSILLYVRSLKVKSCHDLHVVHTLDIWIPCQMPQTMVWWILDHWTPWHYRHPRKTRTSRKCCVHGWVICRWKLNLLAYKRTTAQLEVQSSYFVGTRYLCQISHGGTEQHWDLFSNIFEYKVSLTWTRSFKHCSRNVMATIWIRAFERHLMKMIALKFVSNIQEASGSSTAPNVAKTISCKACNTPVEYPSRECKHDIKESKGNMFNLIFKETESSQFTALKTSGPWLNIKMSSYQYRKSHCGDKTVVRSSYLHNGISYTGKMSSLYWIGALLTNIEVCFPVEANMCVE